jgi:hypothetical protein
MLIHDSIDCDLQFEHDLRRVKVSLSTVVVASLQETKQKWSVFFQWDLEKTLTTDLLYNKAEILLGMEKTMFHKLLCMSTNITG